MRTVDGILAQHRDYQALIKAAKASESPEVREEMLEKAALFSVPALTVLLCMNLQRGFVVSNAVDDEAFRIAGLVIEEHRLFSKKMPSRAHVYMMLRKAFPKAERVHVDAAEMEESTPRNPQGEWVTRVWTVRLGTTPPPSPVKSRDQRSKSLSPRKSTGLRTPHSAGKAKRQISCSQ